MVMLVTTAGAFVRGMERSLTASGSPANVMLLGAGSIGRIAERLQYEPV
jgi:hypothetical protein